MKFNIKDRKSIVAFAVASSLLASGYFMLTSENNSAVQKVQATSSPTSDVELYTISANEKVYINGVVTPNETETFYFDDSLGEIDKVNVSSGEIVDKGHLLYTYKNSQKELELAEKELDLKTSETDLTTLKKNAEDNAVEIKVLEKEIANLKTEIATLKTQVTTSVTAPFAGVVYLEDELNNDSNAFLTIDSRDYYLEGTVNEQDLAKIKAGMGTEVHVFSLDENRAGRVTYVSKRPIDNSSISNLSEYKVRVEFDNQENLVSGFHVQAKISINDEEIIIPTSSIFVEEEQQYVLIEKAGVIQKQAIEATILENDTVATVISGLKDKDVIVRDVQASNLKDGDIINPTKSSEGGEIVDEIEF